MADHNFDIRQIARDLLQHPHALFLSKGVAFVRILHDRNDQLVEDRRCPRDDVQMTIGRGIERSRIKELFHLLSDSLQIYTNY